MKTQNTQRNGHYIPAKSVATSNILYSTDKMSVVQVYDYLWRQFNIKRSNLGTALCLWETNPTIAEATGLTEETVKKAIATLEEKGLYIRIAFNGRDKGLAPVGKSYERKYSIPLDLGHDGQVAIIQECQSYIAQMTEWKDKGKRALTFVEKALTAALELSTTTIAEDLAFDEPKKTRATAACLTRFRYAEFYPDYKLAEAERITTREDNARDRLVSELYSNKDFKVTDAETIAGFDEYDGDAVMEIRAQQSE